MLHRKAHLYLRLAITHLITYIYSRYPPELRVETKRHEVGKGLIYLPEPLFETPTTQFDPWASGFATAREILSYAKEKLEKALKLRDAFLYRNAADKAFLALVVAINAYLETGLGAAPKSHTERRQMLRKMGREDLRTAYSDLMKTLHEETYTRGSTSQKR